MRVTGGRRRLERGLVEVYTGDGRGKTTAAIGLAFRAVGHGLRVHIIQFMKGDESYGEFQSCMAHPLIEIEQFGRKEFVNPTEPSTVDVELAARGMARARAVLTAGEADLVILDELNVAVGFGLVEVEDVMTLLDMRPHHVELLITGRMAPPELVDRADLVTEMREVKHPFHAGVLAREGIDN
ncbi:MAG: cob(I)yrinic acid a,c-diamide adenosyltransferase [Thermoplasmata archaeon]|nr:MAG: cob(I)yrinic acid a,c-diamide adenosyltransferase [Thermoplasmata archaeon]